LLCGRLRLGRKGSIAKRAMRPGRVVVLLPAFDQHLYFEQRVEDFTVYPFEVEATSGKVKKIAEALDT